MKTLELKANWNIVKGRLKQEFARLADDELQFTEGKEDELTGRIQKRSAQIKDHTACPIDQGCGCHH